MCFLSRFLHHLWIEREAGLLASIVGEKHSRLITSKKHNYVIGVLTWSHSPCLQSSSWKGLQTFSRTSHVVWRHSNVVFEALLFRLETLLNLHQSWYLSMTLGFSRPAVREYDFPYIFQHCNFFIEEEDGFFLSDTQSRRLHSQLCYGLFFFYIESYTLLTFPDFPGLSWNISQMGVGLTHKVAATCSQSYYGVVLYMESMQFTFSGFFCGANQIGVGLTHS